MKIMEQKLSNILPHRKISEATEEIVDYIDNRRRGIIKSLSTKWKKYNRMCGGGIEPNVIITIAGISGSGKSAFVNSLETDLFDYNPMGNFVVLNFNLEMLSSRQVGRKLSFRLKKTTQELYSADYSENKLSDEDFRKVQKEVKDIKNYPIYYVDVPGTVNQIKDTVIDFSKRDDVKGKWIIVILDHTLLVKGMSGETERITISNLQKMFMELKKILKITIIQLSQMNRSIESTDRIENPQLHFPMRSDIFGSESIYQVSDYVLVLHRPELIGITGRKYGKKRLETNGLVYMHFLKIREGEPKVLCFKNDLKYNNLEEHDPI